MFKIFKETILTVSQNETTRLRSPSDKIYNVNGSAGV